MKRTVTISDIVFNRDMRYRLLKLIEEEVEQQLPTSTEIQLWGEERDGNHSLLADLTPSTADDDIIITVVYQEEL